MLASQETQTGKTPRCCSTCSALPSFQPSAVVLQLFMTCGFFCFCLPRKCSRIKDGFPSLQRSLPVMEAFSVIRIIHVIKTFCIWTFDSTPHFYWREIRHNKRDCKLWYHWYPTVLVLLKLLYNDSNYNVTVIGTYKLLYTWTTCYLM